MSNVDSGDEDEATSETIVTFDDPAAYARSIRATALVFKDPLSRDLQERIERFARSDITVLVLGETGTGKELAARELHRQSARRGRPFVAVNCAAFSENLVESELFGHERGAFTGALTQKKGWVEAASGGTLFLDEVGDLPLATQVKLLRVLQEREISRVGGRAPIAVDLRFIAATNVNLEDAVRAGRFREDLYFRLNVAQLVLPPLRERPGDILPLTEHFLALYQKRLGLSTGRLSHHAQDKLQTYPWPGNIRELENVIHNALLVMRESTIQPGDLNLTGFRLFGDPTVSADPEQSEDQSKGALSRALHAVFVAGGSSLYATIDEAIVRTAFTYCRENQVHTARLLGISRNILRHRLKLYGVI